jgi:hypothetical protein
MHAFGIFAGDWSVNAFRDSDRTRRFFAAVCVCIPGRGNYRRNTLREWFGPSTVTRRSRLVPISTVRGVNWHPNYFCNIVSERSRLLPLEAPGAKAVTLIRRCIAFTTTTCDYEYHKEPEPRIRVSYLSGLGSARHVKSLRAT